MERATTGIQLPVDRCSIDEYITGFCPMTYISLCQKHDSVQMTMRLVERLVGASDDGRLLYRITCKVGIIHRPR
jgi:hypothetical protein